VLRLCHVFSIPFLTTIFPVNPGNEVVPWGPFLESPGNFSGPKSNIQIELQRIRARVLANKLLHFVSFTDVGCKTIKTSILHVNNNSFTSPLIIGTFEKRLGDFRSKG